MSLLNIFEVCFAPKTVASYILGTQEHTENHQRPEIRNPETRVGVSPPWCMTHGAGVTPIPARCLQNSLKREATDIPVLLPDLLCCGQTPNPVLL